MTNLAFYGLPDDTWDFYRVTTTAPARLKVYLNNFMVQDRGQLLVYQGDCSDPKLINGAQEGQRGLVPDRTIDLGRREAGTIYVAVFVGTDDDGREYFNKRDSYRLYVEATSP